MITLCPQAEFILTTTVGYYRALVVHKHSNRCQMLLGHVTLSSKDQKAKGPAASPGFVVLTGLELNM